MDAFSTVFFLGAVLIADLVGTIAGFGTFMSKERSARGGVNPRNPKEHIQIHAMTIPKFKAGKALKDALKQGQ